MGADVESVRRRAREVVNTLRAVMVILVAALDAPAMGRELDAKIRLGDYFRLDARRKDIHGHRAGPYLHFWNVWLEKK